MKPLIPFLLLCGLTTGLAAEAKLTLVGRLSTKVVSDDSPKFRIWILNVKKPVSMGAGPGWEAVKGDKEVQLFLHDNTLSRCGKYDWTTRTKTEKVLTPLVGKSVRVRGTLVGRILGAMYLPISMDVEEFDVATCGNGNAVSRTAK